ncbi:MAG TPA: hypothetical protein VHM21_02490 [Sphingomicrobium sp.]|jgi:hypothetical protein|nr:hypothetical protein [Sphingomicrobium sp.]
MVAGSVLLAFAAATVQPFAHGTVSGARVSASATATVRILTPAMIGPAYSPPLPTMTARDATVPLPSGGTMPIKLYEFE